MLFILWALSPKIIAWLIKEQLPAGWQLNKIDIGYPLPAGLEIISIELSSEEKDFKINNLFFPFIKQKVIRIEQLIININEASTNIPKTANESKILKPEPFIFEYSIQVKNINITHPEFNFDGDLVLTPKAGQLKGELDYQKNLFPIEANLLGTDGLSDLQLSAKLGQQQFITLTYPWRATHSPQTLSLVGNMQQQLWMIFKNSKLIPLPTSFELTHPSLAFDLSLQWPSWPETTTLALDLNFSGELQFDFEKIQFKHWRLQQNSLQIKSIDNNNFSISTTLPLKLVNNNLTTPMVIENSALDKTIVALNQQKISIKDIGILTTSYQGIQVEIKNNQINYNLDSEALTLDNSFSVILAPNMLPKEFKINQDITLNSQGKFVFEESELGFELSEIKLNLADEIKLNNISFQNSELKLEPIFSRINFKDDNLEQTLGNIKVAGIFSTMVDYRSPENTLLLYNSCGFEAQLKQIELQCSSYPKSQQKQHINSKLSYEINTQQLKASFTADTIQLQSWPITGFISKDLELSQGTASLFLELDTTVPELIESNPQQLLNSFSAKSTFSFKDIALSYGDLSVASANLRMKTQLSGDKIFEFSSSELSLASDLSLLNIEGSVIHSMNSLKDSNNLPDRKLSLDFTLFDGQIKLKSDDFSVFRDNYQLQTSISQLDLEKLLQWIDIKDLTGTGTVSGQIPLKITTKGIEITEGKLAADDTGYLRYLDSTNTSGESNIAMDALKNFHYQELSITLKQLSFFYTEQGKFQIPIRIVGKNPDSQFDNTFAINPNLQGVIPAQTWSQLIIGEIEDKLKK